MKRRAKSEAWVEKREQILLIAARMFAERGWDGITVRDIGRECGIHESALYYYFPSKRALYDSAFQWSCTTSSVGLIKPLSGDEEPRVRLRNFVRTVVSHLQENGAAAALMDRELLFSGGRRKAGVVPEISREPLILLEELIAEISPPILTSLSACRVSQVLWDISYGMVRYRHVHQAVENKPENNQRAEVLIEEVWTVVEHLLGLADYERGLGSGLITGQKARRRQ